MFSFLVIRAIVIVTLKLIIKVNLILNVKFNLLNLTHLSYIYIHIVCLEKNYCVLVSALLQGLELMI